MHQLTKIYSRIIQFESTNRPGFSRENEEFIRFELEKIYQRYLSDSKVKTFVRRQINFLLKNNSNNNYYRLRSECKNREMFYSIYNRLFNFLFYDKGKIKEEKDNEDTEDEDKYYCRWNLGDYILGYIHLREIDFDDEILLNVNYILEGNITKMYIFKDNFKKRRDKMDKEDIIRSNPIYKFVSFRNGKNDVEYGILFNESNPYFLINFAMYDKDFMAKSINLYLDKHIYFKLNDEEQISVKAFIEEKKNEVVEILGKGNVPKDVANLINEMIYPELDVSKIVKKIVRDCEEKTQEFITLVETVQLYQNIDKDSLRIEMISLIKFLSQAMESIKYYVKPFQREKYFRREQLKIASYILHLFEYEKVKHLLQNEEGFLQNILYKMDVWKVLAITWKIEGEDVDWFLELIDKFHSILKDKIKE